MDKFCVGVEMKGALGLVGGGEGEVNCHGCVRALEPVRGRAGGWGINFVFMTCNLKV